jgi:DNA-binding beta-propeller fold protein YncE
MLRLRQTIAVPPHAPSDFDHGDVYHATGALFIAHTALGTVEVLDPLQARHRATLPGCPEASGVLCVQETGLVFAAARGAGKVLAIAADPPAVRAEIAVGSRPNGLAWDPTRGRLLVADVADATARLVDPVAGAVVATAALPGRPRWTVYDGDRDRFLVNIREPARVVALGANGLEQERVFPISVAGPHGLDVDRAGRRAFVACDGGALVAIDAANGSELASAPIPGSPDAIWFNPRRGRVYVAIADPGVLAVVDTETMELAETIETERGAGTTAFDPERQLVHVFLPKTCRVATYEET